MLLTYAHTELCENLARSSSLEGWGQGKGDPFLINSNAAATHYYIYVAG